MAHRRTTAAGCVLTMSVLLAAPAFADPPPQSPRSEEPAGAPFDPAPAMLDAMTRDLGLTAGQATTRLANESRASATESRLRARLGDSFAGAWVTGLASETLVVATTDASQSEVVTEAGAQPKVVDHPLFALDAAKNALDQAAPNAPAGTPVWYVDVRANRVVVLSSQPEKAQAFVDASGANVSLVRVERSSETPRLYYDLRGGDAYYIGGSARCSVGFSVLRGAERGFVSAGHCALAGTTTTGFNQVSQGAFRGSSFPGDDYSWVAVNDQWTPRPWVISGGGTLTVNGASTAVEGSSVCRSGSTTGWRCGTVQQRGASVTYPQGTVYELTRTNVCAEPGDSGGSFVTGDQAQGVTSGGSGNCSSGGTTYFQPVGEILSAYGLSLVTGRT
ncbi:serine protease [Planotetraspora thailandica]|uniref:Serine protease n=1 Tax=Planotetraspora thailandica TaxID=487172 RepID=A0A8J3XXS1_9ACTN|nr:S1 family peptidase [Planotetraspora thailandica]GII53373.1 serine protease [Planotetraspora thailandica]